MPAPVSRSRACAPDSLVFFSRVPAMPVAIRVIVFCSHRISSHGFMCAPADVSLILIPNFLRLMSDRTLVFIFYVSRLSYDVGRTLIDS